MSETFKYAEVNPEEAKKLAQKLHIKKDEINLVRKFYVAEKGDVNESERSIVARVSTIDRDRDGEIIEPQGIDTAAYVKNPVLMWAHRYGDPPIGKALWGKVDDCGLICKFQFAKTQFADEIYQLYKEGYLKAFSIGFIPMDFDSTEKIHKKISLLEVSAVPVPANENALVMEAYAKGIITSEALKKDFAIDEKAVTEKSMDVTLKGTDGTDVKFNLVDDILENTAMDSAKQPAIEFCKFCGTALGALAGTITKPETTENYHRIPVSEGHDGHRIRTITVSADQGIKALYCGQCKEIVTYLFDVDKWTMEEAQAWVDEHKEGKDYSAWFAEPIKSWADLATELLARGDMLMAIISDLKDEIAWAKGTIGEQAEAIKEMESMLSHEGIPSGPESEPKPEREPEKPTPRQIMPEDVREYLKTPEFKVAIDEAIKIGIAKLRGKVF